MRWNCGKWLIFIQFFSKYVKEFQTNKDLFEILHIFVIRLHYIRSLITPELPHILIILSYFYTVFFVANLKYCLEFHK